MNHETLIALQVIYAIQQGFRSKRCSLRDVCEAHDIGCGEIKRLYDCAMRRKMETVQQSRLSKIDANGETALHKAVRLRNTNKILDLVLSGEPTDLKSRAGLSAPRYAEKLGVNCALLSLRAKMKK